jgi:hypothetical protein
MGLEDDDAHYQRLNVSNNYGFILLIYALKWTQRMVKRYVQQWLDISKSIQAQDKIKIKQMIMAVRVPTLHFGCDLFVLG